MLLYFYFYLPLTIYFSYILTKYRFSTTKDFISFSTVEIKKYSFPFPSQDVINQSREIIFFSIFSNYQTLVDFQFLRISFFFSHFIFSPLKFANQTTLLVSFLAIKQESLLFLLLFV